METKKTTSPEFKNKIVTVCSFKKDYTVTEEDLQNQTWIAWSGQQMGKEIAAPYVFKKGDTIMPNKWLLGSKSMTIVVINHEEIEHIQAVVKAGDWSFCNASKHDMRYEVKNVTIKFKYWIISPQDDTSLSLYNSLEKSAVAAKDRTLSGDFLNTGFPKGENSIKNRLEDIVKKTIEETIPQQQPVEESEIRKAIKNAIDRYRDEMFKKYGLDYKDLSVEPNISELQDDFSTKYNDVIKKQLNKTLQESIDKIETELDLSKETNLQTITLVKEKNNQEIKTLQARAEHERELSKARKDELIFDLQAKAAQERERLKSDSQRLTEFLKQNLEVITIMAESGKLGLNLNGYNAVMDTLKLLIQQVKQLDETAKPDNNMYSGSPLS